MRISKVFFHNNQHAFHLVFDVDFKNGNNISTTIPIEVLEQKFSKYLLAFQHAYINSEVQCDLYLESLANKIIADDTIYPYFYPDYLLDNGKITLENAQEIIKKKDKLTVHSGTHYSQYSNKMEFFIMNSFFEFKRKSMMRKAEEIKANEFIRFLFNCDARSNYIKLYRTTSTYFKIYEDFNLVYLILLDKNRKLQLVISV